MKRSLLARRKLLVGGGTVALGGAAVGFLYVTDRPRLRRLLRPVGIRLAEDRPDPAPPGDDGWLLTPDERAALERAD